MVTVIIRTSTGQEYACPEDVVIRRNRQSEELYQMLEKWREAIQNGVKNNLVSLEDGN